MCYSTHLGVSEHRLEGFQVRMNIAENCVAHEGVGI